MEKPMITTNESHAALEAAKARRQEAIEQQQKAEVTGAASTKACADAKASLDELQAEYEAAENAQAAKGLNAAGHYPELDRLASRLSAALIHHGVATKASLMCANALTEARKDVLAAQAAIYIERDRLVNAEISEKLSEFHRIVNEQLAPLAGWLPLQDDINTRPENQIQGLAGRVLAAINASVPRLSPIDARRAELIGAVVRDDHADLMAEVARGRAAARPPADAEGRRSEAPPNVRALVFGEHSQFATPDQPAMRVATQ